jgi:hypothetical protein
VLNGSYQVIYTNPNIINADGWFLGDVVPFSRCAYVVNLASSSSGGTLTKYYTFEQVLMDIEFDSVANAKRVMVNQAFSKTYTTTGDTSYDMPIQNYEINWYPYWSSFYYVN